MVKNKLKVNWQWNLLPTLNIVPATAISNMYYLTFESKEATFTIIYDYTCFYFAGCSWVLEIVVANVS